MARVLDGIAAYGFVLEQDLSDVDWEFAVPQEFVPTARSCADVTAMTGVAFDPGVLAADQFDTARGDEIVRRTGGTRKRRR